MKDLKSGIEHLKQAKAHMSKANGIMSNCISKISELEEENAGLRAKLEAFIQSDDSYMKLPLDADGVPIRIGDVVVDVCGESSFVVDGYCKFPTSEKIGFTVERGRGIYDPSVYQHCKKPEPPDSWEKLEEDANLGCRDYCEKHRLEECDYNMRVHMLARAKKLAGIEEEEQR
jgi:hypothetical protein|nr:MAG TPA: vimentin [Caudoviricetes sp.]